MYRKIGFLTVILSSLVLGFSSCSEKSYGCYDISENYLEKIESMSTTPQDICEDKISVATAE